jgi:hypothetical protein
MRTAELRVMPMAADEVIGVVITRSHTLLWRFGRKSCRRAMEGFAKRPGPLPDLVAAEVGGDLRLASRPYEEE